MGFLRTRQPVRVLLVEEWVQPLGAWGPSTDVGAWLDNSEGFPFCRGVVSRSIGGEDGSNSRGLVQRGLAKGLGWFGLMKQASRIGLGTSLSQNHASLWLQDACLCVVHAFGSEMRLVDGRWDVELAGAACLSLDGWLGKHRVAVRRAFDTRAMWQGVWIREGPQMDLRWFGTWKSEETGRCFNAK